MASRLCRITQILAAGPFPAVDNHLPASAVFLIVPLVQAAPSTKPVRCHWALDPQHSQQEMCPTPWEPPVHTRERLFSVRVTDHFSAEILSR